MNVFIKRIKPNPDISSSNRKIHQVKLDWKEIPEFSVLIGKNGVGKSNLLKQIVYFFNRIKKGYLMQGNEFKKMYPSYSSEPDKNSKQNLKKI